MDYYTPIRDTLDSINASRRAHAAEMLLAEARKEIDETLRQSKGQARPSLSRLLRVSGEVDLSHAPLEVAQSEALGRTYGRTPRMANGFFLPVGLVHRDLTFATGSQAGYLASSAEELKLGVPGASNSFLGLCTVIRPSANTGAQRVGRFDALPTTYILANEATAITEESPTTTQTLVVPTHATAYVEMSRQLALQSEGGAAAMANLLTNAVRNRAQTQILEGTGSNGEVLGLTADSAIATSSGTTVAWSTIAATMETVEKAAGDGALTWVLSAPAAKILRQRAQIANGEAILKDGKIGGYPALIVGGTTAAYATFGRWSDLILYEWSPLEVAVSPFANFKSAILGTRAWLAFGAAPLVNTSFATITSIT